MFDHERASVFFHFICLTMSARLSFPTLKCLTMSTRLSFSTAYVWPWACVCLLLLRMSDHETAFAFSTAHVWPWACARPFPHVWLWVKASVCVRLFFFFFTSYVWLRTHAHLFPLYISNHEYAPVLFHFVCLIMRCRLSFFTARLTI